MRIFQVAILLVTFASCSTGRLTPTTVIAENETVFIGKFKILERGENVTLNSKIMFDENKKEMYKFVFEENGYLYMKIPVGKHFIKTIWFRGYIVNLPDNYASIEVNNHNSVYYIGNIEIDVDRQAKFGQGVVGTIILLNGEGIKLPITVEDNPQEIKDFYTKTFGNDKEIVTNLLTIAK